MMTIGQAAALFAASAFVILVIYLCMVLSKLVITINELTKSVQTLTDDADKISGEVNTLLTKTLQLLCQH